jgi:hypothetical protein
MIRALAALSALLVASPAWPDAGATAPRTARTRAATVRKASSPVRAPPAGAVQAQNPPGPELVAIAPPPPPGPAASILPPERRPPEAERSQARATSRGISVEFRSDFGFAHLFEVEFTNGRRYSMNLNGGLAGAVGVSFLPLADGRLATRAAVGFKLQTLHASNGNAMFTAIPIEVVEVAYAGPFRLGAGASLLVAPRVKGDGFLEGQSRTFAPAPGGLLEAEWLLVPATRTGIGVRASWNRFSAGSFSSGGPAIGLVLRADFDVSGGAR